MDDDRFDSLEHRYNHIDGRVTAVAQDMASVKATTSQLLEMVRSLSDRQNAGTNWPALVSAIVAVIVIMGSGVVMTTRPIVDTQDRILVGMAADNERALEDAYDQGVHQTHLEGLQAQLERLGASHRAARGRVSELETELAATYTISKATGDYVKEFRSLYEKHIDSHMEVHAVK